MLLTITALGQDQIGFVSKTKKKVGKTTVAFSRPTRITRKVNLHESFLQNANVLASLEARVKFNIKDWGTAPLKKRLLAHCWDYALDVESNPTFVSLEF